MHNVRLFIVQFREIKWVYCKKLNYLSRIDSNTILLSKHSGGVLFGARLAIWYLDCAPAANAEVHA